jgi:hypothetical protein
VCTVMCTVGEPLAVHRGPIVTTNEIVDSISSL